MKVCDLIPGNRYRGTPANGSIVTYVGISPGYENPPAEWSRHTLIDVLLHGRLVIYSSRDIIEEVKK